ncbi:hypothetical protein AHAS_Ahas10G0139800 [Arachis hypogaea]
MVVGVFLAVTVAVVEAHRRRCERRSLLVLLLGVWREWPCSASASGFCKLLESSAAGNQHWSCPKLVLCSLLKRVLIHIPCFMESVSTEKICLLRNALFVCMVFNSECKFATCILWFWDICKITQ